MSEVDELRAEVERLKEAMLDSIRFVRMNNAEDELCILLNEARNAGISDSDIDAAIDRADAELASIATTKERT